MQRENNDHYDAFISYSHGASRELAHALQGLLQSCAKPWWRRRSMTIFRDETDLSADPALWTSITDALAGADWLVLLASPEAAASKWVKREIRFWLGDKNEDLGSVAELDTPLRTYDEKRLERLIFVKAAGEIVWRDGRPGDFDWEKTTAIPVLLKGVFHQQPLWVDLSPQDVVAAGKHKLDRSNPQLMWEVARIFARMRNLSLREVFSEDVRQHRRTLQTAWGASILIASLAVIATGAFLLARENERVAVERETIALAALSGGAAKSGQYRDALKLALAAWPRKGDGSRPMLRRSLQALNDALPRADELLRLHHDAPVERAAYSPDGIRLVTVSGNAAWIWDAETGRRLTAAMTHEGTITFAAFSPSGTTLVTTADDGTARMWNVLTGTAIGEPLQHSGRVNFAAFSPDNEHVVTASSDRTARVWDATTGIEVGPTLQHWDEVFSVGFSPDGRFIVTACRDYLARIWDAQTGQEVGSPMVHTNNNNSAEYSANGEVILTTADDGQVRLWRSNGAAQLNIQQTGVALDTAAIAPDGTKVVTGSSNGRSVYLWNATTGAKIGNPIPYGGAVNYVAFSADSKRLVAASEDGTARLWNLISNLPIGGPMVHEGAINTATVSPDGSTVLTASEDGTARVWRVGGSLPLVTNIIHDDLVWSAIPSTDGSRIVTRSRDTTARIWSTTTGKEVGKRMQHESSVAVANFSPDDKMIVTVESGGKTAYVWDANSGNKLRVFNSDEYIWSASFSPDSKKVITAGDDHTARVWSVETGRQIGASMVHEGTVWDARYSLDGQRILTRTQILKKYESVATLWDAVTKVKIGELNLERRVAQAQFSPDGSTVATISWDGVVNLWSSASGEKIAGPVRAERTGERRGTGEPQVVFSPNNEYVAASVSNTVRIWTAMLSSSNGEGLDHPGDVTSITFSPDGKRMLTTFKVDAKGDLQKRQAWLWDVDTGVRAENISETGETEFASFMPAGNSVVVTNGPTAEVRRLSVESNIHGFAMGCSVLSRQIDLEEIEIKYKLEKLPPICGEHTPLPVDTTVLR